LEGNGRGLTVRYYPEIRLEGLRKRKKSGQQGSRPRFEHGIYRIRSRSVNHDVRSKLKKRTESERGRATNVS
jgi:hypothetical protein